MELSAGQLKAFDEQGYVFFPNCFSENEIALLRAEAESILKLDRQEVWREKTGAPRTAFAAHTFSEGFGLLARHPRLIEPLRQLFGEDVYVHQFKLNAKAAFEGDVWQWHQDYGTWARDDGMPAARAMNIAVFLDEVRSAIGADGAAFAAVEGQPVEPGTGSEAEEGTAARLRVERRDLAGYLDRMRRERVERGRAEAHALGGASALEQRRPRGLEHRHHFQSRRGAEFRA